MRKEHDNLLMIFAKNPLKGKVKTRLAKSIGDEMALEAYQTMLRYTAMQTSDLPLTDKVVVYTESPIENYNWFPEDFNTWVQHGNNLGERMANAFAKAFALGYLKVLIIGTDCMEITEAILLDAFYVLSEKSAVVGPALDGGYYLLGMIKFLPQLFTNKTWSTSTVYQDTINDFNYWNIDFHVLATLSDIDDENDFKLMQHNLNKIQDQ